MKELVEEAKKIAAPAGPKGKGHKDVTVAPPSKSGRGRKAGPGSLGPGRTKYT